MKTTPTPVLLSEVFSNATHCYEEVRLKESRADSTGRTRLSEIAHWNKCAYDTPEEAAHACSAKMAKHPGLSYFIQGFDQPLDIDVEGLSHGFLAAVSTTVRNGA